MKKGAAIGVGIAIAIASIIIGIIIYSENIKTTESVTVETSENTSPPEGKRYEVHLSDGVGTSDTP